MTYKEASRKYNVPYSTLHDTANKKYKKSKKGRSTTLTEEQESRIATYILHMAKIGYTITKKDIQSLVSNIFTKEDEDRCNSGMEPINMFGENHMPSITWVYRFLSRWPKLTCHLPENLSYQRLPTTESSIRQFFTELENFLWNEHKLNAKEFLTPANSHRIFSLDETGFPLAGNKSKLKIITEKDSNTAYKLSPDCKEQVIE